MPIGLKEKQAIVAEVNLTASTALSAVMADYRGVSVAGMTKLRKDAREAGVQVRVIRNTLAKLAFAGTDFECMSEVLLGPNVIAFSIEDPGAAAVFSRSSRRLTTSLRSERLAWVVNYSPLIRLTLSPNYQLATKQ